MNLPLHKSANVATLLINIVKYRCKTPHILQLCRSLPARTTGVETPNEFFILTTIKYRRPAELIPILMEPFAKTILLTQTWNSTTNVNIKMVIFIKKRNLENQYN